MYISVCILFITNIGSWIQVAVIKHFFFFQVRNSVFLPQVLYRKSRGRDQEYMPGFSFKLHGCKTLKNSFSLHIDAV